MAQRFTFADAVTALEGATKFGINPSLDGIEALCEAMGRPQDALSFVQVTGTNGKTSVTRMTAALLDAHGQSAAAYTSPHLTSYAERIEIGGSPVGKRDFSRAVRAALDAAESAGLAGEPTEFELLTAAALWLLRDKGVEWGCLEVGMGGRWDATSVVSPAVAVITSVALDHTERLGRTVSEIAEDKGRIIKADAAVVLGPGTREVADVFLARAGETGSDPLYVCAAGETSPLRDDRTVRFELLERPAAPGGVTRLVVNGMHSSYMGLALTAPSYQAANAAVAVAAAECALGEALDPTAVRDALGRMRFPGRFEMLADDPAVVVDGGHNPAAAAMLAEAIDEAWPSGARPVVVLGVLADKDAAGIVEALAGHVGGFVVTEPDAARAMPSEMLAQHVMFATGALPLVDRDPMSAIEHAKTVGGVAGVVVTGSLYLVGQVRGKLG